MADNYQQWSEVIPATSPEQVLWFREAIDEERDEDPEQHEWPPCEIDFEPEGIWVHADESGDLERLAALVCAWQVKFEIGEPWSLTWAATCSKPRIGEFSGGALVCFKGEAYWQSADAWVREKEKELTDA